MNEKIDWESLDTTIKVCTPVIKELPEGLYRCPRCNGKGRIEIGANRRPTFMCGMCGGSGTIKKCKSCKDNPVASTDSMGLCNECAHARMDFLLELENRPEIICNFPQWTENCPNPHLQEANSKGNLVCGLELCEYSQPKEE